MTVNSTRVSTGEFRISHAGTRVTATLMFFPDTGKDVAFPGLSAADLHAVADMLSSEAAEMQPPGLGDAEAVQLRLTGSRTAVAALATWLAAGQGISTSALHIKNRTRQTAQGYLIAVLPKGHDQ